MAIGGVVISFAAKTADAVRDVSKLDRALGGLGGKAKDGGSKFGKFTGSLSNSLPVIGAVIGGVVAAGGALVEASKAAMQDNRESSKLANTLKNIPGITQAMVDANEEWISSMQLATLVSDTELRDAISKLTLATGDLGEAQTLAALAADVAAGSGKEYATVAAAMAKAAAGNTAALERMFPWLDTNKDGTVDLAEAQKILGERFKGAAAEAAKNDPWKRIQIIFEELKEAIGEALLPVLKKLGDWFAKPANREAVTKFLNKVTQLAQAVGDDLLVELKKLVAWLKDDKNQASLKQWAQDFLTVAKAIGVVVSAIKSLLSWWDKLPQWKLLDWALKKAAGLPAGGGAQPWSATPTATPTATAAAAPAPAPPTVVVTEEQIYRAVQRLLLKGQARNGRLVVVG